jgi:DNA gyrase subunit A
VQGTSLRDEDVVTQVVHTSAHAELLFFTNKGKVYRLRAHQIPQLERTARGTAVVNLLQLDADETVQTIIDTSDYETVRYLVFATRLGQVKKTPFSEYGNIRQNGLIAVTLRESDELVRVLATSDGEDIVLVSNQGQAIRFSGSDVRPMGRSAAGVRGMKLRDDDYVVACDIVRPGADLLVVTDQGYGKRTPVGHYPRKGRGTMGVRTVRLRDGRGGGVVAALMVDPADSLILMSTAGVLIRTSVAEIAQQGRDATGVRIMAIPEGGAVAAVAPVPGADAPDEADPPPTS